MKSKQTTYVNPKNGEVWICPDQTEKKTIDGHTFIRVHQPGLPSRLLWMNVSALTKNSSKS